MRDEPGIILRPTRLGFLRTYALAFLFAAIILYLILMGFSFSPLGLALASGIVIIPMISVELRTRRFLCKITEDEIISIHGFVNKWKKKILIESLVDLSIHQSSYLQTLFNFGTVKISSWTSEQEAIEIPMIRKPQEVLDLIEDTIRKRKAEKGQPQEPDSEPEGKG